MLRKPWLLGAILGLVLALGVEGQRNDPPEVVTQHGRVRGKLASVKGMDQLVNVFLGIPFAKPPVGDLRFAPPQAAEPWSHVRESTSYPPMCIQDVGWVDMVKKMMRGKIPHLPVSEDCLYLNVFTPDMKAKMPVMVWIHGGGLTIGAASMYDGSALSAYERVVVVAIQYRLGLHGFFSTGSKDARGNWGLLDQVAALRWVQENIKHFGGDPHSVTIFGESAGGFSVNAHVLSPLSKGLFHRAISESGVALLPSLLTKTPETMAQKVANISGCELSSPALVSCLRSKTEEELQRLNANMFLKTGHVPAVIDGEFIPKDPEELLAKKEFSAVPYLLGVNNDEYGWLIPSIFDLQSVMESLERETIAAVFQQTVPSSKEFPPGFVQMILETYFGDTEDPLELQDGFLDLMADVIFVIPALKTARYHRDSGAPVFFYEYQHRPTAFKDTKPDFVKADHGDEMGFVFGAPFLTSDAILIAGFTKEEEQFSRTIMRYWGNFACNGNPNGKGSVEWPRYGPNEEYLELNLEQKKAEKLKKDRTEFWLKLLPEKIAEQQMRVDL